MQISQAGLSLIEGFEGYEENAYLDQGGVPTIGYGHTRSVIMGDVCTPTLAQFWLKQDVQTAQSCINANVTVPLNQNEFDALCSLVYNIGCAAFQHSTLLKLLNGLQRIPAANQFLLWNKVKGQTDQGLLNRRTRERNLFLKPVAA